MSGTVQRRFQAVISVVDRTAAPLRAIQARVGGLAQMGRALTGVGRSMTALGAGIGRLAAPMLTLAGIGAGGSGGVVAALVAMTSATVDAGGALTDLRDRLGMSIEDIQAFAFAAEQSGASSEQFYTAVERLNRGVADAASGKNQDLAALFRRLRIPLRDANGQLRTASELLPELADAFRANTNGALRTRMAMALFGQAGGRLIAMLGIGREELQRFLDRARELDGHLTDETASALDAVGDAQGEVRKSLIGLRTAIVVHLAPALTPLLTELATWIGRNKELVAAKVEEWVLAIADALRRIDFEQMAKDAERFVRSVGDLVESLGGLRNVMLGLGALVLAPFASAILSIIGGVIWLAGVIGGALVKAFGALGAAIGASGLAALLVPLGKVVAIAALIVGAGYLIYRAWRPFLNLLERIQRALRGIGERMRDPELQRERSRNFGRRGGGGGFYDGPAIDPDTGEPAYPNAPSDLYRRQSHRPGATVPRPSDAAPASAAAASAPGQVDIRVRFDDLPRGARVEASSRGPLVAPPDLEVGYARLGAA